MSINRRDVLLGAAGLPFGGAAMANQYMSDDPWLESGGEHDSQQVSLASVMRRIIHNEQELRRLRNLMAEHGILDSNSDAQSPHPNLDVASLRFGNGAGSLFEKGILLEETPTTPQPGMFWVASQENGLTQKYASVSGISSPTGDYVYTQVNTDDASTYATTQARVSTGSSAYFEVSNSYSGQVASMVVDATSARSKVFLGGILHIGSEAETISAGVAAATLSSFLILDTQGGAATDDLDTISSTTVEEGAVIVVRAANSARTVVAKDGTGNLKLAGDCTLDNAEDTLMLIYDGSNWLELCRSDNGA